jgi:creatinine amidohydrolase/Fe(II)-dependent formamide hydrolase-like protein
LVRTDMIASAPPPSPASVAALIFDRGVTWPWRTDDPRLARMGIIGDPAAASAEQGHALVERMVEAARSVFARLLENQSVIQPVLGKGR